MTGPWAETNGYTLSALMGPGVTTNHPVYSVTWENTVKWCNARSERQGLTPCYTNQDGSVFRSGGFAGGCQWENNGYRLPTEAEWERAARGGAADHRFSWSDEDKIQHARANYYSDAAYSYDDSAPRGYHPLYNFGSPKTAPVGELPVNDYGLAHITGNVREWCWDFYAADYYASSPGEDLRGPASGTERVLRGGGWNSYARYAYGVPEGAIRSIHIADNSILDNHIVDGEVTESKLDNGSVTGNKIGLGVIGAQHIANGVIDSDKLADNSVSNSVSPL